MNIQQIREISERVKRYVAQSRLRDAYMHLTDMSEKMLAWETTRAIRQHEESYRMMLDYASKGADDPERGALYSSLKEHLLTTTDRLYRKGCARDVATLYYNTLRFEASRPDDTIASLLERHRALSSEDSLLDLLAEGGNEADQSDNRLEKERVEKRVFDRVWVSFPLSVDSIQPLRDVALDRSESEKFKQLIVGALLIGELEFHDPARLDLMLDIHANAESPALRMASLVAIVLSINAHRDRAIPKSTRERLEALRESPMYAADLKEVMMELLRSSDTERLTRKLRDEVMPEMLKLRPDISKKITSKDGLIQLGDLEENPEWADKIEKSGLGKKLRELSELQEEGNDVMLGAFAQLKHYPFFNDVVNWMRPYDPSNSNIHGLGESQPLVDALEDGAQLCDSDKYSLTLSLSSLPADKKQMLASALDAQAQQFAELRAATMSTEATTHKAHITNYVRDLYRFFRLFRRKGEFNDPFNHDLNLTLLPVLGVDLLSEDNLRLMGEFLMRRGYYDKALEIFEQLAGMADKSADIYQKLGYCEQRLGNYDKALEYYRHAELLDPDNHWTMRRIAACYRMLDQTDNALEYFKRLERLYPDDSKLAMNIGHCLLELGRDSEAADYFYKVEFLDEKSTKALRPLAWCLLRSRQIDKARRYYQRIIADNPTADDYLNMGHLALVEGDFKESNNYYNMYIELSGGDVEQFVETFTEDKSSLLKAGVDPSLIPLVIDQILYNR